MNQLIPINNENGEFSVSARELHEFLESKQEFAAWIKNRINKYCFTEMDDFLISLSKTHNGRPSTEYDITIDMAKELCMVENNDKGRQARRYFIEVEKKARQFFQSLSPAQQLLHNAQMLVEIEQRQLQQETRIALLEDQSKIDTDYLAVTGYANRVNYSIDRDIAKALGKKCAAECRKHNIVIGKTFHPAFGNVNTYPTHVLQDVFYKEMGVK